MTLLLWMLATAATLVCACVLAVALGVMGAWWFDRKERR